MSSTPKARDMATRNPNAQESIPEDPPSYVEEGIVGWSDEDGSNYYQQGTGENSGYTLVRVQLFKGKPPTVRAKPGVAQGHRIYCRLGLVPFRIPKEGTAVLVTAPGGDWTTPARQVITATIEKNPTIQFDVNRPVLDFGDVDLVFTAKSITLQSKAATPQYVAVGLPRAGGGPSIMLQDETGSGLVLQGGQLGLIVTDGATPPNMKTMLQLTASEIDLAVLGQSGVKLQGSTPTIYGGNGYFYTAAVYLGAFATLATPLRYGTTPIPLVSTTNFGSP